ncbi:Mis14-domain-containing protein [Aspergillus campestris IBT 28561]|uniref:Mis14-domain-containing protein n=1 Tax=Aspergillus campestris (strain IBT 28561) TaxID=1392248 RepID=A0A2I1DEC3_ASPC2|nr:Mis14-domain-containing protein [Aspergillus campestris IBT 28561]PKY08232.1 Mis14-domain-containing protein [Aspergillus campestris IBT 28561]
MAMHRRIELQSPADLTYLHANTVSLSRQKLDLHLPPSATGDDEPDPMRERVRELVDEFITRTFSTASTSISINGLDSSSEQFPFPAAFTGPTETVEYEPYDANLAARVTSLYAQLEALTTSVAKLRREAPARAAEDYAAELRRAIEGDDSVFGEDGDVERGVDEKGESGEGRAVNGDGESNNNNEGENSRTDIDMPDAEPNTNSNSTDQPAEDTKPTQRKPPSQQQQPQQRTLNIPLGTDQEAERWRSGEMAEVYEDALRTLLRLQGEGEDTQTALSSTVGKAERAGRAVEVVEKP